MRFSPLSPDRLAAQWPELRQAGWLSFLVRYGLLRFTPLIGGPLVGITLGQHGTALPVARWMALGTVCAVTGLSWAALTWESQQRRWRQQGAVEP